MSRTRPLTVLSAVAATALLLTACSSGDSSDDASGGSSASDLTIGFAMPDASVTYWTAYVNGVQDRADELGVDVTFTDAGDDANTQLEQVNSLVVTGVDGIVLPPIDTTSLLGAATAAQDAGIPLITSNRALDTTYGGVDGENPLVHVGFNDVEIGKQQGEMVVDLCADIDPCQVALLMQPLGSTPQIERTEGFKDVVEQESNIQIVSEQSDDLDTNTAMALAGTIVQQYPDLDVLASQYDDTAVAAAQAIDEAGVDSVQVVGIGGSKSGVAAVEDGTLYGTVWVSPRNDGADALSAIVSILRGEDLTDLQDVNGRPTVPVDLVKVTADNAADYPGEW
ncbi:MAG TPA: sugar ABC transporter substrate-binding protein [Cellulomonas sp.]